MSSDGTREPLRDAAESKTLSMRRNSVRGNRETLETPAPQGAGRSGKALCRTPDMNVLRESDGLIVPKKRANKTGLKAVAESVEGRGPTKGNVNRTLLAPDTVPGTAWNRIDGLTSRGTAEDTLRR